MDGWTDGQMDGRTDGKSPHSTGLRPLPGLLPCFNKENSNPINWKTIVKQAKGTADHFKPLGDWFPVLSTAHYPGPGFQVTLSPYSYISLTTSTVLKGTQLIPLLSSMLQVRVVK